MLTCDARILQLKGVDNFRDIGGYPGAQGLRIKWGKIFRSGHLARLQKFDCQQLMPLHIQSIFDLRTARERIEFPTRWYGSGSPRIYSLEDVPVEVDTADLFDQIMQGEIERDEVIGHMLEDYAGMPFDYAGLLKLLFRTLATSGQNAVLVYGSAGKDRVDLVISLVMALLGVSFDKIIEDYLIVTARRCPILMIG